ncbi:MAG: hypothetical protein JWQ12_1150 [Glaciihabitans sp.]|nr:hypothetical protein [Glaciihabitans sp.]
MEQNELKDEYEIVINGELAIVPHEEVSYTEVVSIAYPVEPSAETFFTVTYRKAKEPQLGELVEGRVVLVEKKGTIFDVTATAKTVTIIINTRSQPWGEKEITFEQVVELAFPGQTYDPAGTTVEYSRGHGPDHALRTGQRVAVKDRMVFDVEPANRS